MYKNDGKSSSGPSLTLLYGNKQTKKNDKFLAAQKSTEKWTKIRSSNMSLINNVIWKWMCLYVT